MCFAPVLTMTRGDEQPHIKARGTIIERDGVAAARARAALLAHAGRGAAVRRRGPAQHTDEALADWGFDADEIAKLRDAGARRARSAVGS